METNKDKEKLIRKIAGELSVSEAAEVLRIAMEKEDILEEDAVEKFSCMYMGENNKLFTLLVANCDKEDEIHDKLQEIIKSEFWNGWDDEED